MVAGLLIGLGCGLIIGWIYSKVVNEDLRTDLEQVGKSLQWWQDVYHKLGKEYAILIEDVGKLTQQIEKGEIFSREDYQVKRIRISEPGSQVFEIFQGDDKIWTYYISKN